MKTIVKEQRELLQEAANQIAGLLRGKPDARIAMSAGRTMLPLWDMLAETDFSEAFLFQTAEFVSAPEEKTLRHMMETELLPRAGFRPENCFWLTEDTLGDFDERIAQKGGLDLAILGIGDNAHIAFNEPATPYDTRCRKQRLTGKTRKQYSWLFGGEAAVPASAVTMGIHTLTDAGKIMLLAFGEEKAQAVFDMLYARNDSVIPAAFLQLPADVTVYADPEAAGKL
ncbi:MAG: 6-phosphogluconolactonase [Oscillospiraceae bacterium]|nr:6-phosphogluconolactonase [Oscillospiraceae bacterium]